MGDSAANSADGASACVCSSKRRVSNGNFNDRFASVRDRCPALRQVLLHDSIWGMFQAWMDKPDEVTAHRPITYLAFQRGCLSRLTNPVHSYLLTSGSVRPDARLQYIKDLQEQWFFDRNPLKRHQKARTFLGRVSELQFAMWLQAHSYQLTGLEAHRPGPDFEATSPSGGKCFFEVKYIGTEDADFECQARSLNEEPSWRWISPYVAINYLTFRVYEAAKQLRRESPQRTKKVVTLIVDDLTWFRFELPLENKWVDWKNAQFVGSDGLWDTFISKQQRKHPGLPGDLADVIRDLNSILVFRQTSRFRLIQERRISISRLRR